MNLPRGKHTTVYWDRAFFAGWPANHGAWQWGDEFLVGWMRGPYDPNGAMHKIAEPYQRMLARSHDGGETWTLQLPNVNFEGIGAVPCLNGDRIEPPAMLRFTGVYDTGGDLADPAGTFYSSTDRGWTWHGPYTLAGLEDRFDGEYQCTARTRVRGDLCFLSRGYRDIWGADEAFVAIRDFTGFHYLATICSDQARAVMPAVAEVDNRIVVALRRRQTGRRDCWIDVYASDDGGREWYKLAYVGDTGGYNGNPPALMATPDGRLICCYGNRDHGSMVASISETRGATWRPYVFRANGATDIGYPQLFLRSDRVPVCVYYWKDDESKGPAHIVATALEELA